jgi:hypothetical protein
MLRRWTERKLFFVARMKKNLSCVVAKRHAEAGPEEIWTALIPHGSLTFHLL